MSKWSVTTLSDVTTVVVGSTPKTGVDEYWNGEYNWVTPAELKDTIFVINNTERKITEKAIKDTSLRSLPIGTVLLSSRAPIGKVAIAGAEMYCNQGFKNLICSEKIFNKYLFWFLKGKTEFLNSLGRGATFKEISKAIVEKIQIPLPPLETQKQIAKNLDTAADLLAMRKQLLAELDNLIKSIFYDMFGDPVTNEKGWVVSTVDRVCSTIMGGGTPSKSHSEYFIGAIPWVTPKDMKTICIKDSIDHINENAVKNSSANLIPSGSILMVIRSGILKRSLPLAINTVDIAINQDMKAFITSEKVEAEYLLYFFMLMQNNILKNVRAVTADNVEFSLIKNLIIPVPPINLQTKFAEIVTKIEEQKALVKKAIDETQYLFDSLMSEYFEC
ncbi:EcoKI restriction-modification system protein HsdS [Peptococcaceae bacterium CEB3]|nr:EcoKI restriction-modification system protein HsdS [Peptococcaceae bacterium CEB3]